MASGVPVEKVYMQGAPGFKKHLHRSTSEQVGADVNGFRGAVAGVKVFTSASSGRPDSYLLSLDGVVWRRPDLIIADYQKKVAAQKRRSDAAVRGAETKKLKKAEAEEKADKAAQAHAKALTDLPGDRAKVQAQFEALLLLRALQLPVGLSPRRAKAKAKAMAMQLEQALYDRLADEVLTQAYRTTRQQLAGALKNEEHPLAEQLLTAETSPAAAVAIKDWTPPRLLAESEARRNAERTVECPFEVNERVRREREELKQITHR